MITKITEQVKEYIFRRRFAYVKTFTGPLAKEVLEDLARFCRATETTFHGNDRISALQEGRREVFLRIQQHLQLSPDDLFNLVTGKSLAQSVVVQSEDEQ